MSFFKAQAVDENFEVYNKTEGTIYVLLINGRKLDYFPVASFKFARKNLDRLKTFLSIYNTDVGKPASARKASVPFKQYTFMEGGMYKTLYLTWDGKTTPPQTGLWKGWLGKGASGVSLKNTIEADGIVEIKNK